jgi:hypothetical protein
MVLYSNNVFGINNKIALMPMHLAPNLDFQSTFGSDCDIAPHHVGFQ